MKHFYVQIFRFLFRRWHKISSFFVPNVQIIYTRSSIHFTLIVNKHKLKGRPQRHFAVPIKQMAVVNWVLSSRWKAIRHKEHNSTLELGQALSLKTETIKWVETINFMSYRSQKVHLFLLRGEGGHKTKYRVSVLTCPLTRGGLTNAHFPNYKSTGLAVNTRRLDYIKQLCPLLLSRSYGS